MSMSFMSFFIISYYFFLNLVTHDNCISELSAFALQYFSVALYLLCPTFHSWHENHKLNWELWSENWRERERDLKGSWAVKWRRWWQGEGNLLEDKQKRETQMKMRVERYRKRREDKEKWGLIKEDGWIEATELQSAVKYSAYLLCPVSAAQCEMLSRSCERGTASLAFCLCRFVPLRQLVVVFLFCDTLSIPEGEAQLLSGSSPLGGEGQCQTSSSLLKTRWLAQGHFGRVKGRFK